MIGFNMVYDGRDRMSGATLTAADGGIVPFMGIAYNTDGSRNQIVRASSNTSYNFDYGMGRMTAVLQNFAGGTGNGRLDFAYNPASQVVGRTSSNDDYAYTDYVGTNRSYTVNGQNQYTSVGTNAYQYDANGNLTSDGGIGYGYDGENRLISSTQGAGLMYDPLGRLWQSSGNGQGVTQYLHDGDALVAEYDAGGNVLRRYMHGPDPDETILWDEGSALNCSGTKFLHTDNQGSVVAVADCWGNRIAVNRYDEYGVPAAGNSGKMQYTGQLWLPELRMYYYKARIYAPSVGRFMQTDPIGYKDQNNLYAYVANDPVNKTDPTGLEAGSCYGSSGAACGMNGGSLPSLSTLGNIILGVAVAIDIIDTPVSPGPDVSIAGAAARQGFIRAEQLIENKAAGKAGEAATRAKLGDSIAGERVSFTTSTGKRAQPDFVTKDRGIVESKANGGRLSSGQRQLKQDVDTGRPVTPVGQNAKNAGLTPGEPTIMKSCKIDRTC